MELLPDYQTILDAVDRRDLVETLHAAGQGKASNDEERRLVLELLHRKRFINLELSNPIYPKTGMPTFEVVGATLTEWGGELLEWLKPEKPEKPELSGPTAD